MVAVTVVSRLLLLGAGAVLLLLTHRTYSTRETPLAASFSLVLGLLGVTALCIGATSSSGVWNKLVWLQTNLAIPLALLYFSLEYYGSELLASRLRTAAVLAPAVFGSVGGTLVILGTPAKTAGSTAPVGAVAELPAPVLELAAALDQLGFYYTTTVAVLAVGIVAVNVVGYDHLDTRLAAVVAFVGAWPWLGNFVVPELTAAYGVTVSVGVLAAGYTSSAVVAGLAVGPLGLVASSPAAGNVGPECTLNSMADAVVIVDDRDQVLRLNAVARETFGLEETTAVGQPLGSVLGESLASLTEHDPVALDTTRGVRQFTVTRSRVTDRHEFERGSVLVLRDVTQRQTREQRLEVLNRVLRHNLRNNATSILGRAELITDGRRPAESAEQIIDTTQSLIGVAESARDIETMLAASGTETTVELGRLVDAVVADVVEEHPSVEFTTAVPEDTTAGVSPRVLETVLFHLVENAAEHNDADAPLVVVSVDTTDQNSLAIAVSDNGPGIPEHERTVLEAGEEQPLQHGSGLGLWAVYWGVTQVGGTLSISDNDPRGSVVTVTVPATRDSASAAAAETVAE